MTESEDRAELKRLAADLSDIRPAEIERIQAGFDRAYRSARLIAAGLKEPL